MAIFSVGGVDTSRAFHRISGLYAGIAQLVEHNLAKVGVASSSLVSRSKHPEPRRVLTGVFYAQRLGYHGSRSRLSGRVVMQRPAKPCTSVRFRAQPPSFLSRSCLSPARVAKLVDAGDLKSPGGDTVPVRVRPRAPSRPCMRPETVSSSCGKLRVMAQGGLPWHERLLELPAVGPTNGERGPSVHSTASDIQESADDR